MTTHNKQTLWLAALWMLAALSAFVLIAVGARELSKSLSTFQILAIRSAIGVMVITLIISRKGWKGVKTTVPALHLLRNSTHFIGQYAWFLAIGFIPLSTVFAIEMTTPLWTAFWAAIWLGEKFSVTRIIAIFTGLFGVLIVLQPGAGVFHPISLAVLMAAIFYGITHTTTKKLNQYDSSITIIFYMMVMQFMMALLPALFVWKTPDIQDWPWLLLIGLAGLAAHYCLIRALLYADAMVVIPMDFLRLPMVSLVAYLLYGETVSYQLIMGAALVLTGIMINLYGEQRRR